MSNKVDPLALFLSTKPSRNRSKPISLEEIKNIQENAVKEEIIKKDKVYKYPEQIQYFKSFEEKGLRPIHLFIKEDYRNAINKASTMVKTELERTGRANAKMNRHLIANIILDYYFLNNPNFEKSIQDAVFGTEKKD